LKPQPPPMHVQADASRQNTKTTPEPKYWLLHCGHKKFSTKVEDPASKSKKVKKSKGNEGSDQISVLKSKGDFSLLLKGRDQDVRGQGSKEGGIYGRCYGQVLQNHLPENFSWILQYMSAVISCRPMEIYSNLSAIEDWLVTKFDSKCFGEVLSDSKTDNWWANLVSKEHL